jgi:hypothetical protein
MRPAGICRPFAYPALDRSHPTLPRHRANEDQQAGRDHVPVSPFKHKTRAMPLRPLARARRAADRRMEALHPHPAREAAAEGWGRGLSFDLLRGCHDELRRSTRRRTTSRIAATGRIFCLALGESCASRHDSLRSVEQLRDWVTCGAKQAGSETCRRRIRAHSLRRAAVAFRHDVPVPTAAGIYGADTSERRRARCPSRIAPGGLVAPSCAATRRATTAPVAMGYRAPGRRCR